MKNLIISYLYHNFLPKIQQQFVENYNHNATIYQKKNKVVYTCLTGNYDVLPFQQYVHSDWEYVCFTDSVNLLRFKYYGAWRIMPLHFSELDNQLNNRWHKTHPHILFPDYEESIYLDSNIVVLTDWLFQEIEMRNLDLIIPKHFKNDCIYDEAKDVMKKKLTPRVDVMKMEDFLIQHNFPKHYGLNENNIIYRKHNKEKIIKIMEEWWEFIKNYNRRDQLSFAYVLWSNGIKPNTISIHNARFDRENFLFLGHHKK